MASVENAVYYGDLRNYATSDFIRPATQAEQEESRRAAEHDGGSGVIEVAGVSCYVED